MVISRTSEEWALWDLNPRPPACRGEEGGVATVRISSVTPHCDGVSSGTRASGRSLLRRSVSSAMFVFCSTFLAAGWWSAAPLSASPQAISLGAVVAHAHPHTNAWPKPATRAAIIRKIGRAQWNKAERVAYCETGKTVNWYLTGTYRGALGMYAPVFQHGQKVTGYAGTTFPEQVGIAIAAHDWTRGWSGWGCGGA